MSRRSITLAVAAALLVVACSDGSDAETVPGRLVLWNDQSIAIVDDGEVRDVDTTGTVSQVTASPDGTLVWTRIERDPPSVNAVIDAEPRISLDTPTIPFFYQWSPAGDRVALLGNASSGGRLLFGLIDTEAEELTTVQSPAPFFFDWSPDGSRLIAHVAGSVLSVVDGETGDVQDLREESGAFPAPIWTDRGIVVAAAIGPTISRPIVPIGYQTLASEIVLIDLDDDSRLSLAEVEGLVRLFASEDALALAVGDEGRQRIEVIGWSGEQRATFGQGTIDLLQWSPDGATLLWTERNADGTLTPNTWTDGEITDYEAFRPSSEFSTAYLPFWDQYDRTISIWASDSTAFSLPTDEGVVVQGVDGTSTIYSEWQMALWTVGPAES